MTPEYGSECCVVQKQAEILELCEPRILAFDIECEKSPLKFPNAEVDRIFMISYMVKNQGFLIINRCSTFCCVLLLYLVIESRVPQVTVYTILSKTTLAALNAHFLHVDR